MLSYPVKNRNLRKTLIDHGTVIMNQQFARSTLAIKTDEYQYIQRSKVPTMHFQPSLPRLPIPELEKSCQRYLNAQKPVLTEDQMQKTSSYVSKFLAEDGPRLQKELVQTDAKNRHTSYISGPWFDMYLRDRKPLPINYNPCLVFIPEPDSQYDAQLVKATNLVISSLRFMKSLRANILEPEVYHLNPKKSDTKLFRTVTGLLPSRVSWYGAYLFKAFPLDMSQYLNLFNTTRIPEIGKDMIFHDPTARHIVVMRNGYFYTFDVIDKDGYICEPKEIASRLKFILEENKPLNEHPVGVFTAAERDRWANARSHLLQTGNKEVLKKIDSAIFFLILDDDKIGDDYNKLLRTYLHADGTNRWFDKSFSVIVTKDGYAGINFEHSWGDGVAVLRYFQDVKEDIAKKPKFHPEDVKHLEKSAPVDQIQFLLDDKSKSMLKQEKEIYRDWINLLQVDHIIYEGFGKDECKRCKISPDAVMQLAFQLALYNQEHRMVPTYESCSTAAFKHGRTETLRSCTSQTKAFCVAINQKHNTVSPAQLKQMIRDCSNTHNTLTKEAAMGQGFDRHLFALRKISEQSQSRKPAIFEDPAYENLNRNVISTSTLSSPVVAAGSFGPVINEGYGIAYMIQNKRLGATVTSYLGSRNANEYVKSLGEAFQSIQKVLMAS